LAVVLGVGMVCGVLLLVATIRHTFDDLLTPAWGKTDVVVSTKGGLLPTEALARVRATPGVRDAGGMVGARPSPASTRAASRSTATPER
jgi:hypothetical protein